MFEPMGEILDMMRHYGVVIPEETLVQFQELPEKWATTKRLTLIAMQQVKEGDYQNLINVMGILQVRFSS